MFAEDSAVIRASETTDVKFIHATIKALQQHGIENFALRAQKNPVVPGEDHSIAVRLRNGEAELSASVDLPYKYVTGMISMLAQLGVEKIKFAAPTSHPNSLERRVHCRPDSVGLFSMRLPTLSPNSTLLQKFLDWLTVVCHLEWSTGCRNNFDVQRQVECPGDRGIQICRQYAVFLDTMTG